MTSNPGIGGRALRATISVLSRNLLVRIVQFAGTILLARLLDRHDFGVIAFGLATLTAATFLSDVGLGATLVRRRTPPSRCELGVLSVAQGSFALLIAGAFWIAAGFGGQAATVAALMASGLPLYAVRAPLIVELERALDFGPIARAEVVETLAFFVWALVGILCGGGVLAVASAAIFRAMVGLVLLRLVSRQKFPRPRFDFGVFRAMLRQGAKFQSVSAVIIARDQAVTAIVAAFGGFAILGIWSLAYRVMQVPFLLFSSLWRVSFPALAQADDSERQRLLRSGTPMLSFGAGVMVVPLISVCPFAILCGVGRPWLGAADVVAVVGVVLLVSGPISVSSAGFLYARGNMTAPLLAVSIATFVWLVLASALVPLLGLAGAGAAWAVSFGFEAGVFSRAVARESGLRLHRLVMLPAALAAATALPAFAFVRTTPTSAFDAAFATAGATMAYVAIGAAFDIAGVRTKAANRLRTLRALPVTA